MPDTRQQNKSKEEQPSSCTTSNDDGQNSKKDEENTRKSLNNDEITGGQNITSEQHETQNKKVPETSELLIGDETEEIPEKKEESTIGGEKPLSKRKTEETTKPVKAQYMHVILIGALPLLVGVIVAVFSFQFSNETIPDRRNEFIDRLNKLQRMFPNQTDIFWKTIKARSLSHLEKKKPSQPLVIMIGAPPAAHGVVDCLAKQLACALDRTVTASDFIDGNKYTQKDGDITKEELDEHLESSFQSDRKVALVMHLERLPPTSPLLFYKYCDDSEAPYKHVGIIFTVHLANEPKTRLNTLEAERTVVKHLSEIVWNNTPYESDSIAELLSLITDTVALASQEHENVIQSQCKKYTKK